MVLNPKLHWELNVVFFEYIQISKETEAHLNKKIGQFPILHHQQKSQPLCSNTTI
jgi:hypothetical protein